MMQVIVLVLFVMAVAIGWGYASRRKKYQATSAARQGARSSYHCVEVRTGIPACEAAQHLGNIRFLSREAPDLPVPGCTEQTCACRYMHHDDRREDDRRNPYGMWANVPHAVARERRSRAERRRSQDDGFRPSMAR